MSMLAPIFAHVSSGSANSERGQTCASTDELSLRRLSYFQYFLILLLVFGVLSGKAPATGAVETAATVETVNAALDKVRDALQLKVNHDVDATSQAFWFVYDVERARWWADILGAPLSVVEQTISAISAAAALGKLGTSVSATQNGWLGASTFALGIGQLEKAGANLQLACDGPAYATDVKQIYVRAQDASKGEGEQGFERVMREGVLGSTLIRTPDLARGRGLPSFVKDPSSIWSGIEALKGELSAPATAIPPSATERAVERLKELRTTLLTSASDAVEVSVDGETVSLGVIEALNKLHGNLFARYADGLGDEMVKVGVDAVKSSGKALLLYLSFDTGTGPTNIQSSILTVDGVAWTAAKQSFQTDVRTTIAEVPQSMLFALSSELSNAWYLAESTLAEVRNDLFADQDRQVDAGAPKEPPIPSGDPTCKSQYHEIALGGEACGIKLTPDRRVLAGETELPNPFQDTSDVPANEIKLIVMPTSPSGRYTVVKPCSYTCQRLFVVDGSNGAVQGFDAALYGPLNWIAWTDDEQYFLLQNYDEGVSSLQLVHLPEGHLDKLRSFDSDFASTMDAAQSFAWLGPRRFTVALMDACMEGSCGNLEYPRDATRVEFEIADGRLEVKSIEDPSKVPAILRDALQARQTRVELADGTVLNGEVSANTLTFVSSFGSVQVPFRDIQFYKDEAATLNDGSVLKGRFGEGTLEITTSRGTLKIPAKEIVAIARSKPGPVAAAGGSAGPAPGQGVLTGRVLDNFKKPVGNATVRILGSALDARTDGDGRYRLNYVPGQLQVAIEAAGYDPTQFALALSAPTEYPVEDKVLLRLPPGPGVFYWDTEGWTSLQECKLKIGQKLDGEIWSLGEQKETYKVIGTPTRIPARPGLTFLNNTESRQELLIHPIQRNGEIVTAVQYGGLAGLDSSGPTAGVKYTAGKVFQGRRVLFGNFDPRSYAIIDLSKKTCFTFHVGPEQPRADEAVETEPGTSQTLSVDGKTVSYWPASSGSKKEAYFQMESKGYRNTYKLDCAGRRFLWTENVDLATGTATGSTAGAEWKALNPSSSVSNAVYDAICPELLEATDQPAAATTGPSPAQATPVVPEIPKTEKGTITEPKKPNSPKASTAGPTRKQETVNRPPKQPPRDTRNPGSRGYTEKQQRAVRDFNEM